MNIRRLLRGYDVKNLTVGCLGGHSALDVCSGAKQFGFQTLVVAQKGREKTYETYFKVRNTKPKAHSSQPNTVGCIDEVIVLPKFQDILKKNVQENLRKRNTIFLQSRYFWIYFAHPEKVESDFALPIFGSRHLVKLEERDGAYNQYHLLQDAGIRTPKLFADPKDIDRLCIVKASEARRPYERGFFLVDHQYYEYEKVGKRLEREGRIGKNWRKAMIEEFVVGAPVNFNFFYSPLSGELELLGVDMRRQTNLDGLLRLTAVDQNIALTHVPLAMVEAGHVACTVKESLLEKAFDLGERFVRATQKLPRKIDPAGKGIIGPFALQGAIVTEEGREDIVIFDVSFRVPGSPGTRFTPYSGYLYGKSLSMGERIGMELRRAVEEGRMEEVVT